MNANQPLVCQYCSYDANADSATRCEICHQPLTQQIPPSPLSVRSPLVSSKWLVALLLILGVGGGYFVGWRTQADRISGSVRLANSNCTTPELVKQENLDYAQLCKAMRDVRNVPAGLFPYGGAMASAALRSDSVLNEIARSHPEFRLRYTDPLSVPPDSGIGIKMVIDGELSFAQSFRPLKEAEYSLAKSRGFNLKQIPVAIGGIAFYTHTGVKLPGLSLSQVRAIYNGELTNWQQVGGPNLPIVPVSQDPDAQASTSFFLQGLPSQRQHFSDRMQIVRDTTTAIRRVAATPGGIGYGAEAVVVSQRTIHLLGLAKGQSKNYVQPATLEGQVNKEALRDSTYPLARRIFVIFRADGQLDELAGNAYANLLLSNEGQQLVDRAGYLPIRLTNEHLSSK